MDVHRGGSRYRGAGADPDRRYGLRRKKGKFTFRGRKIDTQFSKNAYLMLTITPIVMVALTAVVVLAASHVMIALGAAAAYLFITAVYYTVKLM